MNWNEFEERTVNIKNERQINEVRQFLSNFDLLYDENAVDYTMTLHKDGRLVATGSLSGEVLRNIAIDESMHGEGLTARVVSNLMKEAGRRKIYHYFIYTKPSKAHLFAALGFRELGRAEPYAALLETGVGSIENYCREISDIASILPEGSRACLVVNCNPFTLGHKAVITKAAAENDAVVVLVVSEEKSLFPYEVRYRLVKDGLAGYNNIVVAPAGKYLVSAATFPGYFTRGSETVAAQTRLDAVLFAKHIAPALKVTKRYIGSEPYCEVTRAYNRAMSEILPGYGIEVVEMQRISIEGEMVSASKVRQCIRDDEWSSVKKMVPQSTYNFLMTPEAAVIVEKIKRSDSRH